MPELPDATLPVPVTKKRRKRFPSRHMKRAYIGVNEHVYRRHLLRLDIAFKQAIEQGNQLAVFIIRLPHNRNEQAPKIVQYTFDCPVPVCSRFMLVETNATTFDTLREVDTWAEVLQAAEELQPTIRRGHRLEVYGINAQGLTMQGNLLEWTWTEEATTEPLTKAELPVNVTVAPQVKP